MAKNIRKSCICLYSYIKPQLVFLGIISLLGCICLYSYIKPQQEFDALGYEVSCICLYSYIKPQLRFIIVLYFNQLGYYHRLRSGPLMRDSSAKLLKKL